MNVSNWLFETKDGKKVYAQAPNPPILIAILFYFVSFLTSGDIASWLATAGRTFLIFWALLEISRGVNRFRKILGFSVLVLVIANLLI